MRFSPSLWASGRALTDGKFWRSLGWLLLGVLLMILGAVAWIGMGKNPVAIARKAVT